MTLAQRFTRFIDFFYFRSVQKIMPRQTFRYAVCGAANLGLNWVLYFLLYHFALGKEIVYIGNAIAISPHIAAFLIVFPITFFTGFWLQKNITFQFSPLRSHTQLFRYLISVLGSILLNYLFLKLFVEICRIYPTPSYILTSFIVIGYSYLMQKYFTFRGAADC